MRCSGRTAGGPSTHGDARFRLHLHVNATDVEEAKPRCCEVQVHRETDVGFHVESRFAAYVPYFPVVVRLVRRLSAWHAVWLMSMAKGTTTTYSRRRHHHHHRRTRHVLLAHTCVCVSWLSSQQLKPPLLQQEKPDFICCIDNEGERTADFSLAPAMK